ncbi:Hypothetical predicted protein, partial [Podarcis lilfordi]
TKETQSRIRTEYKAAGFDVYTEKKAWSQAETEYQIVGSKTEFGVEVTTGKTA